MEEQEIWEEELLHDLVRRSLEDPEEQAEDSSSDGEPAAKRGRRMGSKVQTYTLSKNYQNLAEFKEWFAAEQLLWTRSVCF